MNPQPLRPSQEGWLRPGIPTLVALLLRVRYLNAPKRRVSHLPIACKRLHSTCCP